MHCSQLPRATCSAWHLQTDAKVMRNTTVKLLHEVAIKQIKKQCIKRCMQHCGMHTTHMRGRWAGGYAGKLPVTLQLFFAVTEIDLKFKLALSLSRMGHQLNVSPVFFSCSYCQTFVFCAKHSGLKCAEMEWKLKPAIEFSIFQPMTKSL